MTLELASLPVDILELIVSYVPTHTLSLVKCGSKVLNYKLETGAGTSVLIEGLEATILSRWPSVTLRLTKLRRFELKHIDKLDNSDRIREGLRSLPSSSLRTLTIECAAAGDAFFVEGVAKVVDPNLTIKSDDPTFLPQVNDDPSVSSSRLWDVNAHFPNLVSLTIKSFSFGLPWTAADFAHLPRSLESLSLDLWTQEPTWDDLTTLPRDLKFLRLGFQSLLSVKCYSTLPPSLTHMDSIRFQDPIAFFYDPYAPKGLVHVDRNFPASYALSSILQAVETDPNTFWHPSIAHIALRHTHMIPIERVLSLFPKNLVSLTLPRSTQDTLSGDVVKGVLPRTLTALTAASIEWPNITRSTDWPPNLIDLTLLDDRKLTIKNFPRLPRGLTRLIATEPLLESAEADTPTLQQVLDAGKRMLRADIALLYPSTTLSKEQIFQNGLAQLRSRTNPAYYDQLKNGRLAGLPLSLTEFSFFSTPSLDASFTIIPPPFAQKVILPLYLVGKELSLFFASLPSSLAELSVGKESMVASSVNYLSNHDDILSTFKTLQLTTLRLHVLPFGPACLPWLPKTLTRLEIGHYIRSYALPACTIQQLAELPPKLTFLSMPFRAPQSHANGLSSQSTLPWLHLLPSTLIHLMMPNAGCQGEEIKFLSRNLMTLLLSIVYDTTAEHLRMLPRKINALRCDAMPPNDMDVKTIKIAADDLTTLPWNLDFDSTIGSSYRVILKSLLKARSPTNTN